MVSGEVSGKKLLPLGQALGCSLIDGGESVFAGFQQYPSALCAPCVYDIAIADIKLPEPLEYLYAFFVGRNRGRDGEIIRLPDLFQETGMPDQQVSGVFHRVEELLQGLDEQIILIGGEIGA